MSKMLKKEFVLAMHPTVPIMMLLSAMVMIPNYPYSVIFFYVSLSVFFTCLLGRENNDIIYSLSLPVAKKTIVKSRMVFTVILQLLQLLIMIPLCILRQNVMLEGNQAGLDANIALFGWGLIMYGIFNTIFFGKYYKDVNKVGVSFVVASIVMFLFVAVEVASTFAIPFVRDCLDTRDPDFMTEKFIFLGIGALVYLLMTVFTYRRSVRNFEVQDING